MSTILTTQRLTLREYEASDFAPLHEIFSDPDTMQHYPAPFTEEKTKSWIKRNQDRYINDGFGLWAVVLKSTGEVIGDCGLTLQNIDGEMLPEIGYHINKNYQRQGYGKEAAQAVRDWAFLNTKYDAIYSYMKYTNVGSYSTAISNGMKFIKEYPDEINTFTRVYAITRDEWKQIYFTMSPANTKDKDDIFALYKMQIGREFCPWNDHYPAIDNINQDLELDSLFVLKNRHGDIIGAISLDHDEQVDELPCWSAALQPAGEMARVAIHPDYQGHGLAHDMVKYLMATLKTRGYKSLHFMVNIHNVKALRSYEKLQFTKVGETHMYDQPFFCYEKEL